MIPLPTDEIRAEVSGHVATITIARPAKLNSVTPEMSAALVSLLEWANGADAQTTATRSARVGSP